MIRCFPIITLLLAGVASRASAQTIVTSTWIGGPGPASWTQVSNWSSPGSAFNVYPTNLPSERFRVIINSPLGATVNLNTAVTIDRLTLTGANLVVTGASLTALESITLQSNAKITLNTASLRGGTQAAPSVLTLNGGTILASASSIAGFISLNNQGGLIDVTGDTMSTNIVNGTGNANSVSTGTLRASNGGNHNITLGGTLVNTGMLVAQTGGTLRINGGGIGIVENAGGAISALAGSNVQISDVAVRGGTISVLAGSTVDMSAVAFSGGQLTVAGNGIMQWNSNTVIGGSTTTISANGTLNITGYTQGHGPIGNSGSVTFNSAGILALTGDTTLTGNGTINIARSSASPVIDCFVAGGSATLTNNGNTIQGFGSIGSDSGFRFVNQAGLIHANTDDKGIFVSIGGPSSNAGTLKASNGAYVSVYLAGGTFTNTGTLRAEGVGSTLNVGDPSNSRFTNLSGRTLTGGAYEALGSSYIYLSDYLDTNAANILLVGGGDIRVGAGISALQYLKANAATGKLTLQDGATINTNADFKNRGTLQVIGTSGLSALYYTQEAGVTHLRDTNSLLIATSIRVTGGRLEGGGRVSPQSFTGIEIASGGTLAPGNGIGAMTVSSNTVFRNGSTFEVEFNATSADQLSHGGSTLKFEPGFILRLSKLGTPSATTNYTIAASSTTLDTSGLNLPAMFTVVSGTSNYLAGNVNFAIDPAQFAAGNRISLSQIGNNLVLTYNPVPEPACILLIGTAGTGVLGWIRRRRYSSSSSN